ncbi:MAG: T9SS type A sorting domain-containing protein, partial [Chitinophagaceae bacterium]|nr:T9SS type A sorting domain-containing protein [Chitinophagaceae bacterium]
EDGSTDSYEVEYSNTNLPSSFTVIGKIKPQNGNYQFPHFPSSTVENNFYKIRQLDKNGSSTYSHTVLIKSKSNNILQLFPNPVTDYVNLFTQDKNITIAIIDYQGKTLLVQKLINSTEKINLQKLARGTYSILASQNDVIIGTFKIVKE